MVFDTIYRNVKSTKRRFWMIRNQIRIIRCGKALVYAHENINGMVDKHGKKQTGSIR